MMIMYAGCKPFLVTKSRICVRAQGRSRPLSCTDNAVPFYLPCGVRGSVQRAYFLKITARFGYVIVLVLAFFVRALSHLNRLAKKSISHRECTMTIVTYILVFYFVWLSQH